jgi:L-fuculose-phosphate aldolase
MNPEHAYIYSAGTSERALREEIVRVGKLMYDRGLVVGIDGNISARLGPDHILTTPSGLCKGLLDPDQLIVVDMTGQRVGPETAANRGLRPTSETPMHLEAYRRRPDIKAVTHAHPPATIALSIARISLAECLLPEVIVNLGLVHTSEYTTPGSAENVEAIRELIVGHDGIILRRHGVLTVGRSPLDAFFKLEMVEQVARITLILRQLGAGEPLLPEEVEKLLAQRRAAGLARPGEEAEFCERCGVCRIVSRPPEEKKTPVVGQVSIPASAPEPPTPDKDLIFCEHCGFAHHPSHHYPLSLEEQELVRQITQTVLRRLK